MAIKTTGHKVKVNSKDAGDLQSLGSIKQKRAIKEYEALNTGAIVQAIGNIKTDPIAMSVLYNPDDANGAGELEAAFIAGTTIPFAIELSDTITTNGTTFTWSGAVISDFEINQEKDGDVVASFTAALNGAPVVTPAA
jgi:hypothetical protein